MYKFLSFAFGLLLLLLALAVNSKHSLGLKEQKPAEQQPKLKTEVLYDDCQHLALPAVTVSPLVHWSTADSGKNNGRQFRPVGIYYPAFFLISIDFFSTIKKRTASRHSLLYIYLHFSCLLI